MYLSGLPAHAGPMACVFLAALWMTGVYLGDAAGGSVGAYLGMMVFRHKTLKPLFRLGVPVIMLVHVVVAVYVWK